MIGKVGHEEKKSVSAFVLELLRKQSHIHGLVGWIIPSVVLLEWGC